MVNFIDTNRDDFGVEPICRTLQVAPATYYDNKKRPLSARAIRDAMMIPILLALFVANRKLYGAHKLWKAAGRAGHVIGRDQTARLMRQMGIRGVSRKRKVRTTVPDDNAGRPADLVERDFTADRPNRLWVTDLTFVSTRAGVAYVCFIVDAFSRRIVGWRVASHMRTVMVLDALEMARQSRGTRLEGLVAHSDAGSQYTSIRYTERLEEIGAVPSIGSIGDCLLRQCVGRSGEQSLQDRARLRPRSGAVEDGRRPRACHVVVGSLVQQPAPPRVSRRRPPSRVRRGLRCGKESQTAGWKPIETVSNKPRALQASSPGTRTPQPPHTRR